MVRIVPLGCQNPLSMVSAVYSADRLLQSIFGWRVAECINTSHYFLCLIVLNLQPPEIYGGFLLRHVTKEKQTAVLFFCVFVLFDMYGARVW